MRSRSPRGRAREVLCFSLAALVLSCEREADNHQPGAAPSASVALAPEVENAPLRFAVEGTTLRTLQRSDLEAAATVRSVTVEDPYHGRRKHYRALAMREVLELGFAGSGRKLEEEHFVLRATDGYTVTLEGARLLAGGAHLAIDDADVPGWEPIGPQKADPGPYYLVWTGKDRGDLERYPHPWQIASIEAAPFEKVFPRVVPEGEAPRSAAMRGFSIFREQCLRCHAINQQGGTVGPELNIPRNLLEYRPPEQVRAYIRNPESFRYSKMPAFSRLSERDLDDVVAYLRAMGERKQDPHPQNSQPHPAPTAAGASSEDGGK